MTSPPPSTKALMAAGMMSCHPLRLDPAEHRRPRQGRGGADGHATWRRAGYHHLRHRRHGRHDSRPRTSLSSPFAKRALTTFTPTWWTSSSPTARSTQWSTPSPATARCSRTASTSAAPPSSAAYPCFTSLDTARAAVESLTGGADGYNVKPLGSYRTERKPAPS